MTGGALNLSLLSRGVGEVHSNGHEKVDVYLEPEDYYNFTTHPSRTYLPPLNTYIHDLDEGHFTSRSSRDAYRVPKTFTTRKGALLLFSEDLAQRNTERPAKRLALASHHVSGSMDEQMDLKTVEDLAKSILKYGAEVSDEINGKVYLKFVHAQRNNFERQIRPGFSAKRYLATWTRTWDDSVFDNIIKNGYITERSLHQTSLKIPNLRHKLFYEDLSHMPQPYRLLKSMLLTPGSLSGYSFYRAEAPGGYIEEDYMEDDIIFLKKRPDSIKSIRVVKTQEGVQEEVAYSDLDKEAQKDVITDLLVKSAVHYALKKQEEIYEESLRRSSKGEQSDDEVFDKDASSVTYEFDMKDAVESLLDSQHGNLSMGGKSIPGIDDRGHSIDMGGFYKGGPAQHRSSKKHHGGSSSSRLSGSDSLEGDYPGGIPLVSVRRESGSSSEYSGVPVLPPIRHALSPIRDVSRETTSQNVLLPSIGRVGQFLDPPTVNIQPATPQHSTLTASALSNNDADDVSASVDYDDKGSSSELNESHSNLRKSKEKSHKSKRDSGSQSESLKGSIIMAPDGEIISVGGSVARGGGSGHDIGNINDVMGTNRVEVTDESGLSEDEPEQWKTDKKLSIPLSDSSRRLSKRGSGSSSVSKDELDRLSSTGKHMLWDQASKLSGESSSQRSSVTEKDILDTLADHAQVIAENVLARPEAGSDLETDVKRAADLWSKTHPSRSISRDDVIEGILQSTRSSSTASSAAEFKSLISKSLTTAVAKAAGLDPETISAGAEVSPELLEALANQRLTPDQIELVSGEDGKMKIQAKVDLTQAKGGVQHDHRQLAPGPDAPDGQGRQHVSTSADKTSRLDYVEIDKFSYQTSDVMNEKDHRGKSVVASESESRSGSADHLPKSRVSFEESHERSNSKDKEALRSSELRSGGKETGSKARHTASGGGGGKPVKSKLKSDVDKEEDRTKGDEQGTKDKKVKTRKEKKETSKPFVVGLVHGKDLPASIEDGLVEPDPASTGVAPPKISKGGPKDKKQIREDIGKKDSKKTKKAKKKKDKKKEGTTEPQPVVEEEPPSVEPQPPEPVETEETTLTEPQPSSPGMETEESEMDFNFVREPTSPEPDTKAEDVYIPSPVPDEADETDEEEAGGHNLKSISNKEARAAKRAAAAAKKKEEVERRRREMEEKRKREKEEMERQIALQKELEEEKRRKEEERRLRKLQEWETEEREKQDQEEAERRRKLETEREKKLKEEYQRKMEEMRRKQLEEEMRRHELLLEKQKEEERQRIAEELMLSKMAEEERLEYERKKREIEEERKRRELEEKLKREEEARKAFEEAQRLAAEMARKQAELEARLRFNRSLQEESVNLTQSHQVNRAFVFSYFELLQWLGLDIPEFELAKLADY
ncbi:unnamed protein product [Lymnaea stagnalis]|uniref:Uncharacterized protein n=1 Tax=Lymnaea stagnalis TaxID=6523 RepID=A0AAV2HZV3_LYMST